MKLTTRTVRKAGSMDLSLTSMIDVVFLLLVFFLTTTTFIQPRKSLEAAVATADSDSSDQTADLEPAVVRLSRVDSRTVYRFGAVTTTDGKRIAELLRGFSNRGPGAFVEAGPGVPWGDSARIVALCRETGFSPVTWLADPAGEPRPPAGSGE